MNWNKFIEALTPEEKQELGTILIGYLPAKMTKTTTGVYDWLTSQPTISGRLCNVLKNMMEYWPEYKYIEQINKHDFLRVRNGGKKTWDELVKLRGY